LNTTLETTGERFNFDSGVIENFNRTTETSVSVLIPPLDLKYFFYQAKPLKAYGNANLYPLVTLPLKIKTETP